MGILANIPTSRSVLHDAVSSRQSAAVVQTLLDCGLDYRIPSSSGTLLHIAVGAGRADVAEVLLRSRKFDANVIDWQGFTPLHLAVDGEKEEILRLLLKEEGVDVNAESIGSPTPLHIATFRGSEGCVRLLLADERVQVNAWNTNGWTPLHRAVQDADVTLVKLLLAHPRVNPNPADLLEGSTPMHHSVCNFQRGKLAVLRTLLDDVRVRANPKDVLGRTPLLLAVHRNERDTVALFLEYQRVDVNRAGECGDTPLHIAALRGYHGIVEELLRRSDLDLDLRNLDGNSIRNWDKQRRLTPETEEFLKACLKDRG
ncbi:ankyrin [Choiromyces venosus 120613-1]|uniref:Ankyrin n=1 Tax=Choiromyces venosus 120613-1 TaxID=1336337 RepID=A0A3N4J4F4_9PEZI|nr:ankyrin [Choiromyces venosus 120613-1]